VKKASVGRGALVLSWFGWVDVCCLVKGMLGGQNPPFLFVFFNKWFMF